jgi:hypothetical protein
MCKKRRLYFSLVTLEYKNNHKMSFDTYSFINYKMTISYEGIKLFILLYYEGIKLNLKKSQNFPPLLQGIKLSNVIKN